jgi:hypothetical protein
MSPPNGTERQGYLPAPPTPKLDVRKCETFQQPPLDGSVCMADIFDWHVHHSPKHPVFQYVDDERTPKTITFTDMSQAIHRGGWLLRAAVEQHVKPQSKTVVVAVIALSGTFFSRPVFKIYLMLLRGYILCHYIASTAALGLCSVPYFAPELASRGSASTYPSGSRPCPSRQRTSHSGPCESRFRAIGNLECEASTNCNYAHL